MIIISNNVSEFMSKKVELELHKDRNPVVVCFTVIKLSKEVGLTIFNYDMWREDRGRG